MTDAVPSILRPLSNDEHLPPPRTEVQKQAVDATAKADQPVDR